MKLLKLIGYLLLLQSWLLFSSESGVVASTETVNYQPDIYTLMRLEKYDPIRAKVICSFTSIVQHLDFDLLLRYICCKRSKAVQSVWIKNDGIKDDRIKSTVGSCKFSELHFIDDTALKIINNSNASEAVQQEFQESADFINFILSRIKKFSSGRVMCFNFIDKYEYETESGRATKIHSHIQRVHKLTDLPVISAQLHITDDDRLFYQIDMQIQSLPTKTQSFPTLPVAGRSLYHHPVINEPLFEVVAVPEELEKQILDEQLARYEAKRNRKQ